MRRVIVAIGVVFLFLFLYLNAFAGISSSDQTDILQTTESLKQCLNNGDVQCILALLSPNVPMEFRNEVEATLKGRSMRFQQDIYAYENLSPSKIKAKGRFKAEGIGWDVRGFSNYFVFENIGGRWLICDMDFHRKVNPGFAFKFLGKLAAIIAPIYLICVIFWIWMLIDCIKRPIENKIIWLLVVIFLNVLGAILYFLIGRRSKVA